MAMFNPTISIITPTFNRSLELDLLIQSINKQTLDNRYFEMIICDDGSTDDTYDKIKKWTNEVEFRLKYFKQNNLGPGPARNYGVKKSIGELIVFIDSDCEADKDWLKIIYDSYRNNMFDAFGGPDDSKDDFSLIQKAINFSMTSIFTTGGIRGHKKNMLTKFYPRSHNMGVKKDIFNKVGGFGSLRHGQDIELSNKIYNSGAKVKLLINAVVYHRRRTTLKKFFRQVYNWGVARINLGKIDKKMLKTIHFIPSIFLILSFSLLLGIFIIPSLFIPIISFGLLSLFFLCVFGGYKNNSILISFLLLIVIPLQLFGYGLGFLIAFIKRYILKKSEYVGFEKKYY